MGMQLKICALLGGGDINIEISSFQNLKPPVFVVVVVPVSRQE